MSHHRPKTYYEILEVDPNADASTIRKAYLKKSLKYHPDKNPDNVEEAKAKFIEIGQAHETLSDPVKRRAYDRELRSGRMPSGASSFGSNGNGNSNYSNSNFNTNTNTNANASADFDTSGFDSYMDAFDATVAGMSEEELAATVGTISALAGIVGSMVGSHMMKGKSGEGGKNASRGSGLLGTAGSLVGGMVASEIAASSVRALQQDSIQRIEYRKACQRAVECGEPVPEPPRPSFVGAKIGDALKDTVRSVTGFVKGIDFDSNSNSNSNSDTSSTDNGQREATKADRYNKLWKMAAAGVKAAQAAGQK